MNLPNGQYPGRGVSAALGTADTGTEQVAVELVVTSGEHQGKRMTWFGFFTEKTTERTLESLRHLGWQGDDLSDLTGIDRNDITFVVEAEEYKGEMKPKVRWINAPGGMALKAPMGPEAAKAFAAKMKGAVVAQRQKSGTAAGGAGASAPASDDIPF